MSDLIVRKRSFLVDWNVVSKRCVTDPECCSDAFEVCDCPAEGDITGCLMVCELTKTGHVQLYQPVFGGGGGIPTYGPPVGPAIEMIYGGGASSDGLFQCVGHQYVVNVDPVDVLVLNPPNAPVMETHRLFQLPGMPANRFVEMQVMICCGIGSRAFGNGFTKLTTYEVSNPPIGTLYTNLGTTVLYPMRFNNPNRCSLAGGGGGSGLIVYGASGGNSSGPVGPYLVEFTGP